MIILGKEDLIGFWIKFCCRISETEEDDIKKKKYIVKYKAFLLELALKLVEDMKYSINQLAFINSLANKHTKEKDNGENNEEDEENEQDEDLEREIHYKKKFFYKMKIILFKILYRERNNLADLLKEIVYILDFQTIIFPICSRIQVALTQINPQNEWHTWTIIEAHLFAIMRTLNYSKYSIFINKIFVV